MGAGRKELKRNFHGQQVWFWWEEERFEEESQAEHRRCLHPGQKTRPGGKEKGTISLKGKTWERKEAEVGGGFLHQIKKFKKLNMFLQVQ